MRLEINTALSGLQMVRIATFLAILLALAGCHSSKLGQSIGYPEPQRSFPSNSY